MPACGMLLAGPFDWTWMGHNRDLDPQSKTGWASLTFRTSAATLTTRFQVHATHTIPRLGLAQGKGWP